LRRAAILALGSALCAAPLAFSVPASAADAPAAKASAKPYLAPRTAFGQPDISGNWTNVTLTRTARPRELGDRLVYTPEEVKKMESAAAEEVEEGNKPTDPNAPAEAAKPDPAKTRPEFLAAGGDVGGYNRGWLDPGSHVMRVNGEPRTSLFTTPNGQPAARKAGAPADRGFRGLGSFDNPENRSLGERCILSFGRNAGPPMLPNGFYNNNYQILQTPDAVLIRVEMVHDYRIIRLNGQHRTDDVRPYMGDSIGHWDGDTLVVETTNIPQAQEFFGAWKNLKVTEKFRRAGKYRLYYSFQVEDPTVWEKPWGGEYEFNPLEGEIYEYACHEGNYALPGMLAGARHAEEEAAKKPTGGGGGTL
jgi:hypothetical protein